MQRDTLLVAAFAVHRAALSHYALDARPRVLQDYHPRLVLPRLVAYLEKLSVRTIARCKWNNASVAPFVSTRVRLTRGSIVRD
jgi:hypothetical protein